ncbi:MAG TPA: hypothetical protein VFA12_20105 [Stellaceae bacterium]|nr:hypothetical protein [Stellaceae bacterium]
MTIDLTQLATDLTTLRQTVQANGPFVGESQAGMAPVIAALDSCIGDVESALAQAETQMIGDTVAGVVSGVDGAVNAAAFLAYQSTADQAPDLIDMQSYLNRMAINLEAGAV